VQILFPQDFLRPSWPWVSCRPSRPRAQAQRTRNTPFPRCQCPPSCNRVPVKRRGKINAAHTAAGNRHGPQPTATHTSFQRYRQTTCNATRPHVARPQLLLHLHTTPSSLHTFNFFYFKSLTTRLNKKKYTNIVKFKLFLKNFY
jgi:hypothetical protein